MSHCKPYPAYRDSGLEFIGQVPEHWQHGKVAWDMKMSIGWTPPTGNRSYYGGPHNWVSIADLSAGRISETKQTLTDAAIAEMRGTQAPAGSLLFSYKLSIGEVALLEQPAYTNEAIAAFHPCNRVHMPFWKYAAPVILPRYSRMNIYGSELLNQELMNSARMAIPDVCEQQEIANALDRETARIDALITKKTRFIELLKEKRQALITHAVTKGLDTDVPMRESGSDWIGRVPEHWRICSLGYLSRISTGGTPDRKNDSYWNGDIPWIKTGEVNYKIISDADERITDEGLSNSATFIAEPGTILMAMYGMGVTRGRVAVLGIPASFNQACAAISCSSGVHNWYVYYCLCAAYRFIRDLGNEASQVNLNLEIISKIKVPVPPLLEQKEIEKHLVAQLQKLDAIEQRVSNSISLIKERRAAFITAAVTGQIDLRESA